MASNINIKVTADLIDLQTNFTAAQVRVQMLSAELKNLEKQAQSAGGGTDELKAKIAGVSQQLLNAKADVSEFGSQLKEHTGSASLFAGALGVAEQAAGALGVALSAGTFVEFGKNIFANAVEIGRQAQILGLSTDAYQAFAISAKEVGADISVVDMMLQRFTASFGKAKEGSTEQAEAFRELGVSLNQDTASALVAASAALSRWQDTAERARLETVIFSRSGEEANLVTEKWAQGVDKLSEAAKRSGENIDHDMIDKARDATAEWDRFTTRMEAQWTPIVVSLGNAFLDLGKAIEDAAGEGGLVAELFENIPAGALPAESKGAGAKPSSPASVSPAEAARQEIAALGALDPKLEEQATLREKIAKATKALHDEQALAAPDAGAIATATKTIADLTKQLDALDGAKKRAGGGGKIASPLGVDPDMMAQVKAEQDQLRQMDQSDAETSVRLAQNAFDQKKQILGEEVAAGKISKRQELADLISVSEQETAVKLKALSDEIANNATDLTLVNSLENQKKIIVAQGETEIAALRRQIEQQSANDSAEIWKRSLAEIDSAEDTFVSQMMSGRVTLTGALAAAAQQLVEKEIEADLRGLTAHLLLNQQELAADKAAGQMGVIWDALFGQEKVATATAVAAEKNTVTATAAAEGLAAQKAINSAGATGDAIRAAQGAYAAVAGIPYIGPILAPIAAGAAFAAVEAFGSFDVGTNYVTKEMPAIVHPGERIMPAADNRALMKALGTGGGAGQTINFHNTFNHSGGGEWDPEEHGRDIIRYAQRAIRMGALR